MDITSYSPAQAAKFKQATAGHLNKLLGGTPFSALDESLGNFMACHDRFHNCNLLPHSIQQTGNVFITRPKLNLSSPNLKWERLMMPLNTYNDKSSAFMIRCLLDTEFARDPDVSPLVAKSPLLNENSPFLIPACNGLVGISGWPDYTVETETTEGGYFSENQTYAIGSDRLYKTYNLNLTFKDVPSTPIQNLFFYWLVYMASVTIGGMMAYPRMIDTLRLDYTVSIYHFVMDSTRRWILNWGKATGCFPTSLPIGDIFSFSEQSMISEGSSKLTIPFIVNNVSYKDPMRILDFNILVKRYAPKVEEARIIKCDSPYNHAPGSVPYIVATNRGYLLTYRDINGVVPEEFLEPTDFLASGAIETDTDIGSVPSAELPDIVNKVSATLDEFGLGRIADFIDTSRVKKGD